MKKWMHNLLEKITTGIIGVLVGGLMLFLVAGVVHLISLICKWLWTLDWVKNSLRAIGMFISDNSQIFKYIFLGAFFLYLLIIFGLWLYHCIKNGYKYAVTHGFFGRIKRLLVKIANIFLIIIIVLIFIVFTTYSFKRCSGFHINYENYEHRADRF